MKESLQGERGLNGWGNGDYCSIYLCVGSVRSEEITRERTCVSHAGDSRFPLGAARQPRGRVGSRVRSILKGTGAINGPAHGLRTRRSWRERG